MRTPPPLPLPTAWVPNVRTCALTPVRAHNANDCYNIMFIVHIRLRSSDGSGTSTLSCGLSRQASARPAPLRGAPHMHMRERGWPICDDGGPTSAAGPRHLLAGHPTVSTSTTLDLPSCNQHRPRSVSPRCMPQRPRCTIQWRRASGCTSRPDIRIPTRFGARRRRGGGCIRAYHKSMAASGPDSFAVARTVHASNSSSHALVRFAAVDVAVAVAVPEPRDLRQGLPSQRRHCAFDGRATGFASHSPPGCRQACVRK